MAESAHTDVAATVTAVAMNIFHVTTVGQAFDRRDAGAECLWVSIKVDTESPYGYRRHRGL